jgi:uncharacterized protein with von Willebrand factor type A (vWA) domain
MEHVDHAADEVEDVETGNNLARVLPAEVVKLKARRGLRLAFLADYAAKKLPQYRIGGMVKKGLGPVIILTDKSGSMSGERDYWASAISLAILHMAAKDKRPAAFIPYQYRPRHVYEIPVGSDLPLEAILQPAGGGTDIDSALQAAFDLVRKAREEKTDLGKADIILITDGDCETSAKPPVLEVAASLDIRIIGIGLGVPPEAMKPWSHESSTVSDLTTVEASLATVLFAKAG